MAQTKPAGTWTYTDLSALPADGRRYEIIEGELYEMPAPSWAHATVIANLISALVPLVVMLGGRWRTAPLDVFFQGADPVQPDIIVLLPDSQAHPTERGVEGPPDLLVEVLSPSNRGHDLLTKRALHARAGVREYWLVDPEARTIEILVLDRDAFHVTVAASGMRRLYRRCLVHVLRPPPLSSPISTPDPTGHRFPVRLAPAGEQG